MMHPELVVRERNPGLFVIGWEGAKTLCPDEAKEPEWSDDETLAAIEAIRTLPESLLPRTEFKATVAPSWWDKPAAYWARSEFAWDDEGDFVWETREDAEKALVFLKEAIDNLTPTQPEIPVVKTNPFIDAALEVVEMYARAMTEAEHRNDASALLRATASRDAAQEILKRLRQVD